MNEITATKLEYVLIEEYTFAFNNQVTFHLCFYIIFHFLLCTVSSLPLAILFTLSLIVFTRRSVSLTLLFMSKARSLARRRLLPMTPESWGKPFSISFKAPFAFNSVRSRPFSKARTSEDTVSEPESSVRTKKIRIIYGTVSEPL